MALTVTAIKAAKPKSKAYKLYDSNGLYVLVTTTGRKYFRYNYRIKGKWKTIALGVFPKTGLKEARIARDKVRLLLAEGIDPMEQKRLVKFTQDADQTFEAIALEWFEKKRTVWSDSHASKTLGRLRRHVFPWIGSRDIAKITAPDLLVVLRRIESQGIIETAHRVRNICSQIFRYGIATGRCSHDPAADLIGALAAYKPKNMASVRSPWEFAELLRAIETYRGHFITKCALRLAPLVFVRPGELRRAEWSEFDFTAREWRIPAEKMKAGRPHIVPLAHQSVAILEELRPLTGTGRFVFPSLRTRKRPMSDNTMLAALRRLGYSKEEMTVHGFRSIASTLLHENGWSSDVIERQLAHLEQSKVKAAYNHAQYLEERRKMMQWWADYLDKLKRPAAP